jgi:hypothetical protein
VLIYAVRFYVQPSVKLNIHNQCLNVDLVSLTYVIDGEVEHHRPPDYKICSSSIMKSGFIIKSDDVSYGALTYRLQRKQTYESTEVSEDASNATRLLVVWRISKSKELYADVLLIEYDKGFDWEKDNLEELYHKNSNRFRLCPDATTETWSLDANTTLTTAFEITNENNLLNMTITEVRRYNSARMTIHVNPER